VSREVAETAARIDEADKVGVSEMAAGAFAFSDPDEVKPAKKKAADDNIIDSTVVEEKPAPAAVPDVSTATVFQEPPPPDEPPPGESVTVEPPKEAKKETKSRSFSQEYQNAITAIAKAAEAKDLKALEACAPLIREVTAQAEHTDVLKCYRENKAKIQAEAAQKAS
jgi:hypothetical protein